MPSPRIPDDDARVMRAEYEAGSKYEDIAEKWGWCASAVRMAVLRVGGRSRHAGNMPRTPCPVLDRDVLAMRRAGLRYAELQAQLGITRRTVETVLQRARRAEARQ